jgi:cytochrome c
MKRIVALCVGLSLLALQTGALAAGPDAECEALVEKCLALFKDKGKEAALAAINNPQGLYIKGDLYVFALSLENVMLAHPYDKSLRAINLTKVRDARGHRFFEKFGEIAASPGAGWVEYTWNKPGDVAPAAKRSYIKRVPNEDCYVGCGYYVK